MEIQRLTRRVNDYGMTNRGQLTSEFLGGTSLQLGGCVGPCVGTNVSLDGQLQGVAAGESGLGTPGASGGVGSSVSLGKLGGN